MKPGDVHGETFLTSNCLMGQFLLVARDKITLIVVGLITRL